MTELADFGAQMTRIAGEMRRESDDTEAALRSMTKFAVDAIPGAEYATVTLVANGTIETPVMVGDLGGQAATPLAVRDLALRHRPEPAAAVAADAA